MHSKYFIFLNDTTKCSSFLSWVKSFLLLLNKLSGIYKPKLLCTNRYSNWHQISHSNSVNKFFLPGFISHLDLGPIWAIRSLWTVKTGFKLN